MPRRTLKAKGKKESKKRTRKASRKTRPWYIEAWSFDGKFTRRQLIRYYVGQLLPAMLLLLILVYFGDMSIAEAALPYEITCFIPTFWICMASFSKRCRDIGITPWLVVPCGIGYVYSSLESLGLDIPDVKASLVSGLILCYLLFRPSKGAEFSLALKAVIGIICAILTYGSFFSGEIVSV